MNLVKLLERLGKIPRSQRLILYGALYVIIVVAYWGLLYLPKGGELDALRSEKATLLEQRSQIEARVKDKALFEEQLKTLMADLQQALKELPNDREIPGLLKSISTMGKKVGLEVRKFAPLDERTKKYVAEVPVALEVEGAYHEVAMFFDRLSKMNRIVYVQDIEMNQPQERGGKVYLTVTGKAVTFRFLTDEEIQRAEEASKAKRGRGKR